MKKTIFCLFLCILSTCLCVMPATAGDFLIISDWAKEEVLLAGEKGLYFWGEPVNRSDMRRIADRGQAVRLVLRLAETLTDSEVENTAQGIFPDVTKSSFREDAEKAYSAGIVNGYSDGEFHTIEDVTREQYIVMLYRALQYVERSCDKRVLAQVESKSSFADADEISSWAKDAIDTLTALGIVQGKAGNRFAPQDEVSVEEILVLSYRCYTLYSEE